jgi:GNAT superfamily N-acetyltransferase
VADAIRIESAVSEADFVAVRLLFEAYAASLRVNLSYQDFVEEVTGLPGKYAAPDGVVLLAYQSAAAPVGCIAMRPMARPAACEMKRLYVTPSGRGLGVGKALATALIEEARPAATAICSSTRCRAWRRRSLYTGS